MQDSDFVGNNHGNANIGTIDFNAGKERVEIIPSTPQTGQYLRVWIPSSSTARLTLCEVEVFREEGKNTFCLILI